MIFPSISTSSLGDCDVSKLKSLILGCGLVVGHHPAGQTFKWRFLKQIFLLKRGGFKSSAQELFWEDLSDHLSRRWVAYSIVMAGETWLKNYHHQLAVKSMKSSRSVEQWEALCGKVASFRVNCNLGCMWRQILNWKDLVLHCTNHLSLYREMLGFPQAASSSMNLKSYRIFWKLQG